MAVERAPIGAGFVMGFRCSECHAEAAHRRHVEHDEDCPER